MRSLNNDLPRPSDPTIDAETARQAQVCRKIYTRGVEALYEIKDLLSTFGDDTKRQRHYYSNGMADTPNWVKSAILAMLGFFQAAKHSIPEGDHNHGPLTRDGKSALALAWCAMEECLLDAKLGALTDYRENTPVTIIYPRASVVKAQRDESGNYVYVELSEVEIVKGEHVPHRRILWIDKEALHVIRYRQTKNGEWSAVPNSLKKPDWHGVQTFPRIPFRILEFGEMPPMYDLAKLVVARIENTSYLDATLKAMAPTYVLKRVSSSGNAPYRQAGAGKDEEDRDSTRKIALRQLGVTELPDGCELDVLQADGGGVESLRQRNEDFSKKAESQLAAMVFPMNNETATSVNVRRGMQATQLVGFISKIEAFLHDIQRDHDMLRRGHVNSDFVPDLKLTRDPIPAGMTNDELRLLLSSHVSGTLSRETFIASLIEHGKIATSLEEEMDRIKREAQEESARDLEVFSINGRE